MPDEWINEETAADQLGVPRDALRAQRPHLGPGEVRREGNAVQWLLSAAQRIAAKLGLSVPEKKAAPETQPDHEELTVVSQPMGPSQPHFAQAHLIRAKRASGELVVVRVTDSRKFLPKLRTGEPMKFQAKKAAEGNWWLLIGHAPRFPGQW